MCSNSIENSPHVLPGILSIGIQPLAVCQSMDHGHTAEAVTADTLFWENVPRAEK